MTQECTQKFAKDVLNHMRERLGDYQEEYGDLYNLEATPAESTTYRLAKHDCDQYPDIITACEDNKTPYYTNSSHLPVGFTEDIFEALDIQDQLQTLYTSGTVFHAFIGEKLPSWQSAAMLVKKIAQNYKLPYYTISPTYSICREHGYLSGEHFICPECGIKTEVYSRITGYYRPVQNWNEGKSREYKDRRLYLMEGIQKEAGCEKKEGLAPASPPELILESPYAGENRILFITKTCPNCKTAKSILDKANLSYETALAEENMELVEKYGIRQAPALVVRREDEIKTIVSVPDIKQYVSVSAQQ